MKAIERTLVLIKPDAIEKDLVTLIRGEIEVAGLTIVSVTEMAFDMDLLLEFYAIPEIRYPHELVEQYICAKSLPVWIVDGETAIGKMVEIKSRLRAKYGTSKLKNLFHCPDTTDEFDSQYDLLKQKGIVVESTPERTPS